MKQPFSLTTIPGFRIIVSSTLLGTLLYFIKVIFTGDYTYIFLFWNLFLAALPLFFAYRFLLVSQKNKKINWESLGAAILWLLFFPNAPYILTDFIHLVEYQYIFPIWYDAIMIGCFTLSGMVLGCVSLQQMQTYIRKYTGTLMSWFLVILTILLSSFAIYIGRYVRLNSWDVVVAPVDTTIAMIHYLLSIGTNESLRNIMIFFTLYQMVAYAIYYFVSRPARLSNDRKQTSSLLLTEVQKISGPVSIQEVSAGEE